MMQYLPTGGFEWVHLDTISPEYWTNFVNDREDEQDNMEEKSMKEED